MIDHGVFDHHIIAVLEAGPVYTDFKKLSDFREQSFKRLRWLFEDYKVLEGKSVAVDEILPAQAGLATIEDLFERYERARHRAGIWPRARSVDADRSALHSCRQYSKNSIPREDISRGTPTVEKKPNLFRARMRVFKHRRRGRDHNHKSLLLSLSPADHDPSHAQ